MSKRTSDLLGPHAGVMGIALVYLLVALALLPGFRWAINADGISYIAVARRYLAGDWHAAVNGYWGPLLSWLLVPFLAMRMDALLAGKLISMLTGLVTIPGLNVLAKRFDLSGRQRMVVLAAMLPLLWLFTFYKLTPDFLMVCVLVWYFGVVFDLGYGLRIRDGIICGVLGALAYCTKAFGLPFFLAHFTLMTVLFLCGLEDKSQRRGVLRNYLLGMVIFVLFAGGWIMVLSGKYEKFTVGNAGSYAHALNSPDFIGQPPVPNRSFIAPADPVAISMWEDPSFLPVLKWSATESVMMLKHQVRVMVKNTIKAIRIYSRYSPLFGVIVVVFLVICVKLRRQCLRPGGEAAPLLTFVLYSAGYVLVLVEVRYVFACVILLAFMGAQLAKRLECRGFLSGWQKTVVWLVLALSMAVYPVMQTATLYCNRDGQTVKDLSVWLAREAKLRGGMASNRYWAKSLFVAYHLELPYYGAKFETPDDEIVPVLMRMGVRYYFVWGDFAAVPAQVNPFPELTGGRIDGLRVYDLASVEGKP